MNYEIEITNSEDQDAYVVGFTTDEDNTFKVTGWIKELDLPGYNWMFTPDWDAMPDPPQEYLDSLEPHEQAEYRVVDTLGRGSAGRVGRGKSFISAEENFDYERCEMILEWV